MARISMLAIVEQVRSVPLRRGIIAEGNSGDSAKICALYVSPDSEQERGADSVARGPTASRHSPPSRNPTLTPVHSPLAPSTSGGLTSRANGQEAPL